MRKRIEKIDVLITFRLECVVIKEKENKKNDIFITCRVEKF